MKKLIKVTREVYDFPENFFYPQEYTDSILIPTYGMDFMHFYFLVDFQERKIISWEVDLSQIALELKKQLKVDYENNIPLNQKNIDDYLQVIYYDHSADYYKEKIYISYVGANFILELNRNTDEYNAICDQNFTKVYSTTNMIQNGKMYFTRWEIGDSFKRVRNNFSECVNLEIGYYDLEKSDFVILHSFTGADDIHSTMLSACGNYIFILEMCQEPNKRYPEDIDNASAEVMLEILKSQLRDSHLYTYDIRNNKMLDTLAMGCSPAHIDFDLVDPEYFYIAQHNNSVVSGGVLSFGHAFINKIYFKNGKLQIVDKYAGNDLFRTPSNRLTVFKGKQYILCPGYYNQVHLVETSEMKLYKQILLTGEKKQPDYTNGPPKYSSFTSDKTPFTIHGIDNTSYLYLASIWNLTLLDFESEKRIEKLVFNTDFKPIVGLGHTTKIPHQVFQ